MAVEKSPLQNPWLLAITPTMLGSLSVFAPFISLRHRFFYHLNGSASTLVVALLLNLLLPWLLFAAVFTAAARFRLLRIVVWSVLVLLLPWFLLRGYAVLMDWYLAPAVDRRVLFACLAALGLECLLWRNFVGPRFPRLLSMAQAGTALVSLGWLVTLGQLAYYAVATRGLNAPRPMHSASLPAPTAADGRSLHGRPRIIWIILDELGQDEIFDRRMPGLGLPAFDALAAQSAVFTQAVAPGIFTEQVIPALMLGDPAQRVAFTVGGNLLYQTGPSAPWQAFQPGNTVFADALHEGYTTAVDGWHNPYCRILAPVLDSCFWSSRVDSATPDFDADAPLGTNLAGPLRRIGRLLTNHGEPLTQAGDQQYLGRHIQDVRSLMAEADRLIANPAADFLLLHIPVPHPGGIYDRRRGVLTNLGHFSYVDNLALADRLLAHLREELEARGEWDPSAVIVMGDHGWRTTLLWKHDRGWTPEDEVASHGGAFDPRPAYIVKLPQEHTGVQLNQSFPTLRTRSLLDAVMGGSVRTPADLQAWIAKP